MHELSIVTRILDICLERAQAANASHITCVQLAIGELSSVVDDSVAFYWDILSEGTLAQGANLEFERIPASFLCGDCAATYGLGGGSFRCPECGGANVQVCDGEQFYIDHIEVDVGAPADARELQQP